MRALAKIAVSGLIAFVMIGQADARSDSRSWDFSVLLDGSPIGYHRFELQPTASGVQVVSEANFNVRVLFLNAFRYRHNNREIWDGNCLRQIESRTRQNSKRFAVTGSQVENRFVLESEAGADDLGACVKTFAYWDPRFLEESRLLNPQSGEYMPVNIEALGRQDFVVRGESVPAVAYRITARKTDLTVWYSDSDEWLGLESVAKGGRIIRYELT